jgi:transcription elongation factor/antiterminator RfaH
MAMRLKVMLARSTKDNPGIRSTPEPVTSAPINLAPQVFDVLSGPTGKETPVVDPYRNVFHLCDGERWYVVQTRPHREFRAQTQLTAQGFRSFLPLHRKTVRHARKLRTLSAPFFPGYLFMVLDLSRDRWRSVNGTFGVARLVMGDEFPVAAPSGVVESLRAACTADGHLRLGELLGLGERVRVLSGPFADLVGELTRIDGAARVVVLLRLLGGEVPVSIPRLALLPARAA